MMIFLTIELIQVIICFVRFEMVRPTRLLSFAVVNICPYLSLKRKHVVCSISSATDDLPDLFVCPLRTTASSASVGSFTDMLL